MKSVYSVPSMAAISEAFALRFPIFFDFQTEQISSQY